MRRPSKLSIARLAITGFAGVLLIAELGTTASAQAATGTVTGRVVVCRRLPLPVGLAPDAAPEGIDQTQPLDAAAPEVSDLGTLAHDLAGDGSARPALLEDVPSPGANRRFRGVVAIPARNVLIVADGTGLSTRADETGHFALADLPAPQVVTIIAAADPVGNAGAQRPNVSVTPGQSVDLGTLVLGAPDATGCELNRPELQGPGMP